MVYGGKNTLVRFQPFAFKDGWQSLAYCASLEEFIPKPIQEEKSKNQGERELEIVRELILDRMEWLQDSQDIQSTALTSSQRKEYDELKELNKKLERY